MTIGTTAASIVNQSLQQIGAQAQYVSGAIGTWSVTTAGQAAATLYQPTVNLLLREMDPEFARTVATLAASAATPAFPFTNAYTYPTDCQRIRQVWPSTYNTLDPQPSLWSEQDAIVAAVHTRVIFTSFGSAMLTYTTSNVTEDEFDPIYQEVLVRLLASELVIAIGGRPDLSKEKLGESGEIARSGMDRDS